MDPKVRMGAIVAEARAIQRKADAARRDLTQQESDKVDALFEEFERLEAGEAGTDGVHLARQKLRLVTAGK